MITWIIRYRYVIAVVVIYMIIASLMRMSFNDGVRKTDEEWQAKEKQSQYDRMLELRAIETRERQRQSEIIREYNDKLAALEDAQKRQIDQILDSSSTAIRNAGDPVCPVQSEPERMHSNSNGNNKQHNRTGLSSTSGNRPGTVCYTEKQLRRQIAESVAIGQECDREMKRFKALIEVCRESE
jgi:hypothetical protein